ncbi:MAG: 50S ribosomal protein L22 [Bacteroidales bacterium]|nr:50S ribosomal protein L22 [Bacteroidales bacterium]MBN2818423.1 50S ribosomal protein L22 [Bacteroidales bacterium]
MGARKRNRAEELKNEKKSRYQAVLNNCPTSPRKMRLVADMVRGKEVNLALDMLKYSPKEASRRLEKLVLSAVSNWQNKNEGARIEDSNLIVKEIQVNQGRTLKRIKPAPQGRAYRVRKRSNHVTVVLGTPETNKIAVETVETANDTQTK